MYFTTLTVLGDLFQSGSYSLRNILNWLLNESPCLGPNNFLCTLFSATSDLCSSLRIKDHVSRSYKTTVKLSWSFESTRDSKSNYWWVRSSNPVGARYFSFFENVQTGCGAHTASYSVGTGVLPRGYSGRSVKLTAHLHLVPRLRMSGAIPLLPLYAFRVWTGKTLPLISWALLERKVAELVCKHRRVCIRLSALTAWKLRN